MRSADCSSRSSSARSAAAAPARRASSPPRRLHRLRRRRLHRADAVTTGLIGGWWPDRIVPPALELAFGVVDRRRALAARLGLPLCDRQRDRRLHGLRRWAHRRSARPDRPGRSTRDAQDGVPRRSPGRSPSRRSTRTRCMRSPRTPPSPASSFGSGPSAARTPAARGSAPGSAVLRDRRLCARANRFRPPRPLAGRPPARQRRSKTAANATVEEVQDEKRAELDQRRHRIDARQRDRERGHRDDPDPPGRPQLLRGHDPSRTSPSMKIGSSKTTAIASSTSAANE